MAMARPSLLDLASPVSTKQVLLFFFVPWPTLILERGEPARNGEHFRGKWGTGKDLPADRAGEHQGHGRSPGIVRGRPMAGGMASARPSAGNNLAKAIRRNC